MSDSRASIKADVRVKMIGKVVDLLLRVVENANKTRAEVEAVVRPWEAWKFKVSPDKASQPPTTTLSPRVSPLGTM